MPDIVIKAECLGKKYTIGHQAAPETYVTLRDELMHNARKLWNTTKDLAHGRPIIQGDTLEEVWALRDVSFDVPRSEVLGIIGRNGAGKSTLLKILSRITRPTTGSVTIKGQIASLLEVGTGFHAELTGRENIYLNGAILGMTRAEIKRKFDEIVAFADVEKFLDTPVKRYSSGMYVRLAFAVAAHLDPQILIVDEVLAVGDVSFQQKCLGKMNEVATQQGRTVLFVSHSLEAVSALCSRCALLRDGGLVALGETADVVAQYLGSDQECLSAVEFDEGASAAYFQSAALCDDEGIPTTCFTMADTIRLRCRFLVRQDQPGLEVTFSVFNIKGERIFYSSSRMGERPIQCHRAGLHAVEAIVPPLLLPGRYHLNIALQRPGVELYDHKKNVLSFDVIHAGSQYSGFSSSSLGYVNANVVWRKALVPA